MATKKKSALGKGLGALLADEKTDITSRSRPSSAGSISQISVEQIETNPFQPRTYFEQEALSELAESIRVHGIIQPITVRKISVDKYQLISGERRFRASQIAGLTEVPAYVRIANDQTMLEMALVENIQRQDLDPIEVAMSYERLMEECKLTQEELSSKVAKSRSAIANQLRLLKLPAEIQSALRKGQISAGHARALLGISDDNQRLQMFKEIVKDGLSVREAENRSKEVKNAAKATNGKANGGTSSEWEGLSTDLAKRLNTGIKISANNKGGGKLVINFKDQAELQKLTDLLL